jgi:hypothetical protein
MHHAGREESTAGPWLLGIILLALVVWVASMVATNDSDRPDDARPVQSLASSAAFAGWVRDSAADARRTQPARQFVSSALRRMTVALSGEVSRAAPGLAPDIRQLDAEVTAFVADTAGDARYVRTALDSAIALIRSIRERVPPAASSDAAAIERALEHARAAVAAVEPDGAIEAQTLTIERAMRELAEALQLVAGSAGSP